MFKIMLVDESQRLNQELGPLMCQAGMDGQAAAAGTCEIRFETESKEALAVMLHWLSEAISGKSRPGDAADLQVISQVDDYISRHYQEKISLACIARSVHMNASYLSRLYHRETGLTLTQAIARHRIRQACTLLAGRNDRMGEIAARVGIDDPAYFSVLFRRYALVTPSEYRSRCASRLVY